MGFSIQNAATQNSGNPVTLQSGGGVWCASASAVVVNCVVSSNRAISLGGGVFQGTVINSLLRNNNALTGGGAASNILMNCTVISNSAYTAGGIAFSAMTNCIAYFNSNFNYTGNHPISYSCTTPLPTLQPGGSNRLAVSNRGVWLIGKRPCASAEEYRARLGEGSRRLSRLPLHGCPHPSRFSQLRLAGCRGGPAYLRDAA